MMIIDKHAAEGANRAYREALRGHIMPGVVEVLDEQFTQITAVVDQYHSLATLRRFHDVDDFVMKHRRAQELKGMELGRLIFAEFGDIHVKEMVNGLREATNEGKRLAFITHPTMHLKREAYQLEIFSWCHCVVACSPTEPITIGCPVSMEPDPAVYSPGQPIVDLGKAGETATGAMVFRPHCPGHINDGEAVEGPQPINTLDELRAVPQVKRFLDQGGVLSLSPSPGGGEALVMATMPNKKFWVIGYLPPIALHRLDLPRWKNPDHGEA